MMQPTTAPFRAFRQFTEGETDRLTSSKSSVDPSSCLRHFPSDEPADQVARAIGRRRATSIKEFIESFEFYEQTRKTIRARHMIDLCCGHGLTGMLFAALDRSVESVTLVDKRKPKCHDIILQALCDVAPWTREKIHYLEWDLEQWSELTVDPADTSVLGVHACGTLTDHCLKFAAERDLPIAVMPCCYPYDDCPAPKAIQQALGSEQAFDVERTYRLEKDGYRVKWGYISKAITPMNRIITAVR